VSAAPDLPLSFEPAPLADDELEAIADGRETGILSRLALMGAGSWRIGSLGEADWAMSKFSEASQELARLDAHAAESHARIDAWRAQAGKRAERTRAFFEGHLTHYAASQRTEQAKTLYLPGGAIASTHHKAKVVVVDKAAAVAWARTEAPAAIKTEESILLGPLREAVAIQPCAVGEQVTLHLSCGHTDVISGMDWDRHPRNDGAVIEEWTCYDCDKVPFRGNDLEEHMSVRQVLKVEKDPIIQPTVFGPDGEAVSDTILGIEAEAITFTIKPDLG
jgi:hypothetical protein